MRAALFLVACTPRIEAFSLPSTGPKAVILVTIGASGAIVTAIDPSAPWSVTVEEDARVLYALEYGDDLGALGFLPGTIAEEPEGRRIPAADRVLAAEIRSAGLTPWIEGELPDEIRSLRIGTTRRCSELEVEHLYLPNSKSTDPYLGVSLDDESALVALEDGRFFRVTSTAAVPLTGISTATPRLAAFRDPRGELWLLGRNGRVARGDLERGFTEIDPLPSRGGLKYMWLEGSRDASAPFELFAVTDRMTFDRFDGEAWERLDSDAQGYVYFLGDVVWLGPSDAIAVGVEPEEIVRYTDGEITRTDLPTNSMPASVAMIPRFGLVVADGTGRLFHLIDGAEEEIGPSPLSPYSVIMLEAYEGSILFGGGFGEVGEYIPGFGFCRPLAPTRRHLGRVMFLRDGILMVTNRAFGDPVNEVRPGPNDSLDAELLFLRRK